MNGFIYIASAFKTVNRSACGQSGSWVDNDPHFWTNPPTWGICRNDLRAAAKVGDVVFFVLPKGGRHPQTVFGYLTIEKIVSHTVAYHMPVLVSKRMGNKIPNGNIIVDASGGYNRYDLMAHHYKWKKISKHYAIGEQSNSRFLVASEIHRKAPTFLPTLIAILGKRGMRPIDVITRKGAKLNHAQVVGLLNWLNTP